MLTLEGKMRRGMKSRRGVMRTAPLMVFVGASSVVRYAGHAATPWRLALAALTAVGFAYYAWTTYREAKRLFDVYEDRLRELLDSTYHAITFTDRDEASAFVAALGRQLHAPRDDLASWEDDVEISATSHANGTTLYLSDGAMRSFATAFATPPETRPVVGWDLPSDRIPLLVGAPAQAIGRDDVLKLLAP